LVQPALVVISIAHSRCRKLTITVPAGCTLTLAAWGAGGGGGGYDPNNSVIAGNGGGGGFASAVINVGSPTLIICPVGGGGGYGGGATGMVRWVLLDWSISGRCRR